MVADKADRNRRTGRCGIGYAQAGIRLVGRLTPKHHANLVTDKGFHPRLPRIHILGASGSGTSTLGSALARRLGVMHADSDSFFWLPTDPPFTTPRPAEAREELLLRTLPVTGHWVFSGAATQWAAPLEPYYELVVFLYLDPATRMARLRQREASRFGARILPGGDMEAIHATFIAWAEAYDTLRSSQRSLVAHTSWLSDQTVPVLRLDSQASPEELVAMVLDKVMSLG